MKKAFTLIELLVVIAIIAILAAILFPVFAQAKASAKNSTSLSNIKQIGLAQHMYFADNDDQNPQGDDYAEWVWLFVFAPYIKSQPADFSGTRSNFFYSPTAPGNIPQYLSGNRYDLFVNTGMAQQFRMRTDLTDPAGVRAIVFWASYSINEHTVQEWPNMSSYADPAGTLSVLEGIDTEIEGDELRKLFGRPTDCSGGAASAFESRPTNGGYAGGSNFLFIDSHAKYRKHNISSRQPTQAQNFCDFQWYGFPQGGRGGSSTAPSGSGVRPDCGEWTAPQDQLDASNNCVAQ